MREAPAERAPAEFSAATGRVFAAAVVPPAEFSAAKLPATEHSCPAADTPAQRSAVSERPAAAAASTDRAAAGLPTSWAARIHTGAPECSPTAARAYTEHPTGSNRSWPECATAAAHWSCADSASSSSAHRSRSEPSTGTHRSRAERVPGTLRARTERA